MTKPYAMVSQVWSGGPNSLLEPEDMNPITFSKKELIEFGGTDKEKINFTVEYDVTKLKYAANISIALIFDKTILVSQTNLKSVQGAAIAQFRMPFLPKHDNQKKVGAHSLDIAIKLRPRWSIWHLISNYKDFTELSSVAESTTSRQIILTE